MYLPWLNRYSEFLVAVDIAEFEITSFEKLNSIRFVYCSTRESVIFYIYVVLAFTSNYLVTENSKEQLNDRLSQNIEANSSKFGNYEWSVSPKLCHVLSVYIYRIFSFSSGTQSIPAQNLLHRNYMKMYL